MPCAAADRPAAEPRLQRDDEIRPQHLNVGICEVWMHCSLAYDDRLLGEVDFGAPNERGLRIGFLRPTAAYFPTRARLQEAILSVAQMKGASGDEIHAHVRRVHAELAAEGLMLVDEAGKQIPTEFLQVVELAPLDTAPDIVETLGVQVAARFTPAPEIPWHLPPHASGVR